VDFPVCDTLTTHIHVASKATKCRKVVSCFVFSAQDIIERNIKKAADSKNANEFQECVYEAYGIGGTAFLIECLTDNVNRTVTDVKTAVTKGGGKVVCPTHPFVSPFLLLHFT
jgi:hypothetical protein